MGLIKNKLRGKGLAILIIITMTISLFFLYLITTSLYVNHKKIIDILSMINLVVLCTALIHRGQISMNTKKRKHSKIK